MLLLQRIRVSDFLLLQVNDSLFPIGGYTHSFGLESYIQMGEVRDRESAYSYVVANLNSQILYNDLLMIKLIFDYRADLQKVLELEGLANASASPMELREGVQKLGNRFIKTISVMGLSENEGFTSYLKASKNPTHASAYGVFCVSYGLDYKMALRHYLYAQSSSIVTNCVKTIPLSQNDGQVILSCLHKEFEAILSRLETLRMEHFCASSVHNDIKAMQHETLYSRLYMS